MKLAVLGATGTAGSRTVDRLEGRGEDVVAVSRSSGVDLISGTGLNDVLAGVDVVIDASNTFPIDERLGVQEAIATATRHVLEACTQQGVRRLVLLSIAGIEDPTFDEFDYYLAKRHQERLVSEGRVPASIVKSTQWYEFATNPAAVTFHDHEVVVRNWLIQPIAADTVADVLVQAAADSGSPTDHTIAGPQPVRLPELTRRLLEIRGDPRAVRAVPPPLPALDEGVLLAPENATLLGPDLDTWLASLP
jgi:uncharacterized protein YbjT (DUF2867 family)